ncbi:hypothetical protein C8J57DRAFT_499240 [Mycena rebaudengoi]|nr:hypothetical protein C8J57DRAFT_499240 [Mycena rebaudengoi]
MHEHEQQEKKDPQLHVFVHLHVEEETNTKHLLPTTYPREPAERLAQRGTSMQEHKHEEAQPCPRDLPSDGARARGDGAVLAHVHVGSRTTRNIRPPTYAPARFPSSLIVGYPLHIEEEASNKQLLPTIHPPTYARPALCAPPPRPQHEKDLPPGLSLAGDGLALSLHRLLVRRGMTGRGYSARIACQVYHLGLHRPWHGGEAGTPCGEREDSMPSI